ncbi:MAG: hypothetical protein ACOCRX_01800 [Candidatus Woesearchaeota archaeon]
MELVIGPAIVIGIIIALIEMHFVHIDEGVGRVWIKHAWHSMPFAFMGVFINMNVPFVVELLSLPDVGQIGVQAAVSLLLMIKMAGAASIGGQRGIHEKWVHILIIGALMFGSHYIWEFFLEALIGQYIPF